jgi:hypothetical protein
MRRYSSPYGEVMQRTVNGATTSAYRRLRRQMAGAMLLFWEPKLAAPNPTK